MLAQFFNRKISVKSSLVAVILTFMTVHVSAQELVFILAGQSNMAGQGNSVELPASFQRVPSNIEFYYNGYKTPLNRFSHFGQKLNGHPSIINQKSSVYRLSIFAYKTRKRGEVCCIAL